MMQLTNATKVKRHRPVTTKIVNEQLFVFDDTSGNLYSFNESAGEIWNMMKSPITVADLVEHMVQTFSVSKATAKKDILHTLQFLIKHDFVTMV